MHSHKLFTASDKVLAFALSFMVFIGAAPRVYCQQQAKPKVPIVQLGDVKTGNNMRMKVTKDQVISNPVLKCRSGEGEVTSFTISFAPKGENIVGPYKTEGYKIKPEQLKMLQSLHNPEIKIFIEDIHVNKKSKDIKTLPLVLICVP